MGVYEAVLTGSRSCPDRAVRWTPAGPGGGCPCDGVLTIAKGRRVTHYAVTEVYPDAGYGTGRAFQLRKADGTGYSLFIGPGRAECDCPGMAYEATARADRRHGDRSGSRGCCHLDGMAAVIARRWLPDPRANPDADASGTEAFA